jgi:hypothetical protein
MVFSITQPLTEDVTKENVLIDYILKDEIDDVISQIQKMKNYMKESER